MMIEYNHATDSWTVITLTPVYRTLAGPFHSCSQAIASLVDLTGEAVEPVAVQNDITSPLDLNWETPSHYPYNKSI